MKIFDVFPFYNELELLELRLNTLADSVDYFVITEAKVTFSGKPKALHFLENKERFKKFQNKIIHNVIETTPEDYKSYSPPTDYFTLPDVSYRHKSGGVPFSKLGLNFQREIYQRDSCINGLLGVAEPEDLIMISDLDEIPNPAAVGEVVDSRIPGAIYTFCQKWFMYYFNVYSQDEWFGTRICDFGTLKGRSIDLMRYHLEDRSAQPGPVVENGGWHFSFLGGEKRVREKLAAYSYQGRRTKFFLEIMDRIFPSRIRDKIANNQDIFGTGRKFKTAMLDKTFPAYLLANREKFKSFIKS